MNTIEPAAIWLALTVGGWAAVGARVSFGGDARLVRSGARALHAAAALFAIATLAFVAGHRVTVLATPGTGSWAIAVRELLAAPDGMLLLVGAFASLAAGLATHGARAAPGAERRAAHFRGGLLVAAAALVVILARASWGDAVERPTPVELFHSSGMAFRVLYAAGIGTLAAAVVLIPISAHVGSRLRVCTAAFAIQLFALTLGAWARYSAVAPAPELDAGGTLLDAQWSTAALLLLVPPLFTAAAVAALYARVHHANVRSRGASLLLLTAAAMIASAVLPSIRDWVVGREVAFGMPISPLHAWEASLALALAVACIAWLALRAFGASSSAVRLMRIATAAAVGALGLAILALSTEPRHLTLQPGATAVVSSMGPQWRFVSQGASQEEAASYDGALVAFEITSGERSVIAAAGERIYRDAHGHPSGRVAVPGVVRGVTGDLRFTVRALRGDEAMVRVQFHPLASLAWLLALFTVVAFGAFALWPQRSAS